jgi:CDP-glycerol glycerophosphotransferase (TagB/SpsB family)
MCGLDSCALSSNVICLLEHYLVDHKFLMIMSNNYYLVYRLPWQSYSGKVVCMYTNSYQGSNMIDLPQYCNENVMDVRAVHINISNQSIVLVYVYQPCSGHFGKFAVKVI